MPRNDLYAINQEMIMPLCHLQKKNKKNTSFRRPEVLKITAEMGVGFDN